MRRQRASVFTETVATHRLYSHVEMIIFVCPEHLADTASREREKSVLRTNSLQIRGIRVTLRQMDSKMVYARSG